MSRARAVRWVVIAVCVIGIAGMIVGSIADDNGVALTFGLVTAAAALCLIVATAVTTGTPGPSTASTGSAGQRAFDEAQAARVEELIQRLVAEGAAEHEVRDLVREAVRLGSDRPSGGEIPHIGRSDADD